MNTAVFIKGSKEKSKILKNENWKKKNENCLLEPEKRY